jgi:hypothetical protein
MPIIYLEHPQHGTKVAIAEQEAEYDEQNGWTRYTPGEPKPEPVNELRPRRRRESKDAELL